MQRTIFHSGGKRIRDASCCAVAAAATIMLTGSADVGGQVWTYIPRDVSTPSPQGIVSAPTACREGNLVTDQNLPDGDFLKLYTLNFRVDTAGSVAGACDWYLFGSYY